MIAFDGHDLDTIAICGDQEITIAPFSANLNESESRNGAVYIGSKLGTGEVRFSVAVLGNAMERRRKISTLANWLNVDSPRKLVLPDSQDLYYLAVPNNSFDLERHFDGEVFELGFTLVDPVAYGKECSFTVPYGGSVRFVVGGTYPTYPYRKDNLLIRPDQTSKLYGLRLDNSDVWIISGNTTSNFRIRFDMGERESYVNDEFTLPTLSSTWFELTPGEHVIENHIGGGNDIKISYRERWL